MLREEATRLFPFHDSTYGQVETIVNWIAQHVAYVSGSTGEQTSAMTMMENRQGVCRDFAHLAITLCRCMNIPARYCTGYLSEIGEPLPHPPGDFAAWMEVFLSGEWHMFDPRNNKPRFARILIARGRDAADVPLTQTFGQNTLTEFKVWTDELA